MDKMKPEFKAMYEASIKPESGIDAIRNVFLSSLHWRGDELWAGPVQVGRLWFFNTTDGRRVGWARCGMAVAFEATEEDNRAALEAAAKKQINEWFQEQAK